MSNIAKRVNPRVRARVRLLCLFVRAILVGLSAGPICICRSKGNNVVVQDWLISVAKDRFGMPNIPKSGNPRLINRVRVLSRYMSFIFS